MPYCTNCGSKLAEGAKFCFECGARVETMHDVSGEQRKAVYEGTLHKCPNCGEILNSFVTNCPTCGHEVRDTQVVSSVRQLSLKLAQLESKRQPRKAQNIFAQAFGGGTQLQSIDEQKIELIRNFAIPNTKEDVLEFIVLAAANIDMKVYGLDSNRYQMLEPARRELSDAWLAKLEQADQKAEILFGHTQEYLSARTVYEKKMKAIKKQQLQIVWLCVGVFGSLFLMAGFILGIIALAGGFG